MLQGWIRTPTWLRTSTRVQNNSWKPLGNELTSNKQRVCVSFSCDQAQSKQWAAPLKGGKFYNSLRKAEVSGPFSKFQSCVKPNRVSPFHQWRLRLFMLISTSPLCPPPYQTAAWVNFFFWLFIGALLIFQRRQSSGSKMTAGGVSGPVGSLFGDPGVTAAETEPFFNRPARPQWGRAQDGREQYIFCRKLRCQSICGKEKSDFAVEYFRCPVIEQKYFYGLSLAHQLWRFSDSKIQAGW